MSNNCFFLMISFLVGLVFSAAVPLNSVDVLLKVNQAHLEAIKNTSTVPPEAARNLAMMHQVVSMSLAQISEPCRDSVNAQVASIVHGSVAVLEKMYPSQNFDELRQYGSTDDECSKVCAIIGRDSGELEISRRINDGSAIDKDYVSEGKPGQWVPTPPAHAKPLLPNWGNVQPFGIQSASKYVNATGPALTTQEYLDAFEEVKNVGSDKSTTRTDDQTNIALFWASGSGTYTPPGQWNAIAQLLVQQRSLNVVAAAHIFEKLNVAMADAGIVCWANKYVYGFWRPITAIRHSGESEWTPLLSTPPFPEYTSGHSSFSGAAATVLTHYFGDNAPFTLEYFGLTRSYTSIAQALEDAGKSRIYGGIHFELANRDGKQHGKSIALEILSQ